MSSDTTEKTQPTYPFRLQDPVNGRCVRARFIARLKDITDCYAAWEIVAPVRNEPRPNA